MEFSKFASLYDKKWCEVNLFCINAILAGACILLDIIVSLP
jgi:hypothetical protein